MQCSNCQFENMPGITTCGRCGTSLQLASATIDVHPPRANRIVKRWRRWFPLMRYWNRFRNAHLFARVRISGWPTDLQRPGVLLRMIVPGWAQRYTGRLILARWMFGCYLAVLLLGLLFTGTVLGWLLLGLAVSIHATSILDIVGTSVVSFRLRLIYTGVAITMLTILVYYPAGRLLSVVANPQQFSVAAPPFEAGDVLLVNSYAYRWSDPQPGDVVHYALPTRDVQGRLPDGHAMTYRLEGDRINRILAKAGQRVTSSQGNLLIDGQPSLWLPLGTQSFPDSLDITVPVGSYLIFPSTDQFPPAVWQIASIVPRGQIWGRVYWRSQPLWRFGPIR
jgi:hypothetical protein